MALKALVIDKLLSTALTAGGLYLGYSIIKSKSDDNAKKRAIAKYGNTPELIAAMNIRKAINPSGLGWLEYIDGYNFDNMLNIAKTINNWPLTVKLFKELDYGDLDLSLQRVLNDEQYSKFMTAVQKLGAGQITETPYKYEIGETVYPTGIHKVPVQDKITNKSNATIAEIRPSTFEDTPITILSRGRLTITYLDGSKKKFNFYKCTLFSDPLIYGGGLVTGYIEEKYLTADQPDQVSGGVDFLRNIGDAVRKINGTVRAKSEPTANNSFWDTILTDDDNSIIMNVIDRRRVPQNLSDGTEIIANWYKVTYSDDNALGFKSDYEKWIRGSQLRTA